MRIALATDHAGFEYKQQIKAMLAGMGHEVVDFGTHSAEPCDYPKFVIPAARALAAGEADRAIVFGGSGNGEAIAANRVRGVRCAYCFNTETARLGRLHNDANCIALGSRIIDLETAKQIVNVFLEAPFEGGRHVARIRQLDEL